MESADSAEELNGILIQIWKGLRGVKLKKKEGKNKLRGYNPSQGRNTLRVKINGKALQEV